ncbi:Pyruvic-ferredoxin oxidoreductase subunit delta [Jannaschia seosinensis]|uniref:Pyruvic-ferredoxin oxidoreductase subunit delta n=1 Tax=Jannaschia seosinensis TaxID=313367 RepID=A0A0M7BCD4_9RHOB|nr:4Fe-4S binding protein [Jannaschia seosinensis]CUH38995.1 Pyruvic-ferredoxin oxidoreductase subunit delta [Jannaschia seosinensis]
MSGHVVLCNCAGTQAIDAETLSQATGRACGRVHDALCLAAPEVVARAFRYPDTIMACGQEAERLTALAIEGGAPVPRFVDIRDRAGWGGGDPTPKQAALLAEAALPAAVTPVVDVTSQGLCLIAGPPDAALAAAERLHNALAVTVLLPEGAEAPQERRFDIVSGRIRRASGAFGGFEVMLDSLRMVDPAGRDITFGAPRDGAKTRCDVILDLTGGTPLFPAHHKREGYLRPDPKSPLAVADAVLEASQMVGTFEKVLHVRVEPALCAHSRAEQTGCTRCLDLCPTSAITPVGDHVSVDPMICAGCGACSAACPSGAISYDAPPVEDVFRRIEVLARVYRSFGRAPSLVVHDDHGREMIALSARHGRGLPDHAIPLHLPALAAFGHAEMLAALGAGFARVDVIPGPRTERAPLEYQAALADALAGRAAVRLLDVADPDAMESRLCEELPTGNSDPILPLGTRRQVTRVAAAALHDGAPTIALPEGAPYGAVLVDKEACTLCLSCVSLCPSGALLDNPDRPELRFQEDACLQCGLCANICPEDAIALEPRMDLSPAALSPRILNAEEPAECVECGKPFGVASTIERIAGMLADKHPMFGAEKARMIRMCDTCRVNAMAHSRDNPFAGAPRPVTRSTDDYLN